tara:strand:+ start:2436 stop:2660 length:225 start_codon:yes stop_codon:yes gene_type:complete
MHFLCKRKRRIRSKLEQVQEQKQEQEQQERKKERKDSVYIPRRPVVPDDYDLGASAHISSPRVRKLFSFSSKTI